MHTGVLCTSSSPWVYPTLPLMLLRYLHSSSLPRTPSSSPNFSSFTRKLLQEGSWWSLVLWDRGIFKPGQSLANLDWEVKSKADLTFESTFVMHPSSSRKPSVIYYSSGLKVPTPSWVVHATLHSPLPPFPLSFPLSWVEVHLLCSPRQMSLWYLHSPILGWAITVSLQNYCRSLQTSVFLSILVSFKCILHTEARVILPKCK